MKSAIYFEDGLTQVVLTPENAQETAALALLDPSARVRLEVRRGEFYDCRGGFKRSVVMPFMQTVSAYDQTPEPLKSTILVIRPQEIAEVARDEHRNRGEN